MRMVSCCGSAAMIAMSVLWLLVVAALLLGIAALIKYLRSSSDRGPRNGRETGHDSDETGM